VPFIVGVTPANQTVARGGTITYTVTLTSTSGFAGEVSLSVSGLPNKTTGSFNPQRVTLPSGGTGTSILTIATERNGGIGTYTLTITGTSGSLSASRTVTLTLIR
jgi:uncharacterized membrane protein